MNVKIMDEIIKRGAFEGQSPLDGSLQFENGNQLVNYYIFVV